jgi:hypothetical protein
MWQRSNAETSAQHTSAYVSIRQHTSAYVRIRRSNAETSCVCAAMTMLQLMGLAIRARANAAEAATLRLRAAAAAGCSTANGASSSGSSHARAHPSLATGAAGSAGAAQATRIAALTINEQVATEWQVYACKSTNADSFTGTKVQVLTRHGAHAVCDERRAGGCAGRLPPPASGRARAGLENRVAAPDVSCVCQAAVHAHGGHRRACF